MYTTCTVHVQYMYCTCTVHVFLTIQLLCSAVQLTVQVYILYTMYSTVCVCVLITAQFAFLYKKQTPMTYICVVTRLSLPTATMLALMSCYCHTVCKICVLYVVPNVSFPTLYGIRCFYIHGIIDDKEHNYLPLYNLII